MNIEERKYDYLKFGRHIHAIASLTDIPILILLYALEYYRGFNIFLVLVILSQIAYAIRLNRQEKELNID